MGKNAKRIREKMAQEAAIVRVISYFKTPHDPAFCALLDAVVNEDK
ncbi:hypothetical protein [Halocynthiibacter styelae]|uniref:Uncharacterized protein n=1 Tax=Halocynthiibacter styelae TaxID=2761955 RepID=A0A8J7IXB0_9RHOB|nr:hypothetical protein [Paenihalocynthiibacter styelae]MBI1494613.1 hypothetical protein [Paenihalocynthiibacter styelae]